ncbi:hypothetical protein [Chryseobacterium sp. 5_R23647]|uniref:hypothetical protein n=1 Tax=Chryseobacterium sp. 5_R23647 TaxID=2258964 RepID=UPI000E226C2B|nr:hypothetical protein [Chryseobacterium sp. 5_R23647]REC39777.1 hypothetical protein DRF69_21620 [Chryseobacterium sp. 5_R23647]
MNLEAQKSVDYYDTKEDQFTFVVLNKNSVENFFKTNKDLNFKNTFLKKMILDSLYHQNNNENLHNQNIEDYNFSKNTTEPNQEEFKLSQDVIKAVFYENQEEYFVGALDYFFYFTCLPSEFKYKWTQTSLGHFKFNSTFFSILRDNSSDLDKIIYGDIGNYDENLKIIFQDPLIYNEITPEIAERIKSTILGNEKFLDKRFEQDKLKFLLFLNKTIEQKWRMILIDWN